MNDTAELNCRLHTDKNDKINLEIRVSYVIRQPGLLTEENENGRRMGRREGEREERDSK